MLKQQQSGELLVSLCFAILAEWMRLEDAPGVMNNHQEEEKGRSGRVSSSSPHPTEEEPATIKMELEDIVSTDTKAPKTEVLNESELESADQTEIKTKDTDSSIKTEGETEASVSDAIETETGTVKTETEASISDAIETETGTIKTETEASISDAIETETGTVKTETEASISDAIETETGTVKTETETRDSKNAGAETDTSKSEKDSFDPEATQSNNETISVEFSTLVANTESPRTETESAKADNANSFHLEAVKENGDQHRSRPEYEADFLTEMEVLHPALLSTLEDSCLLPALASYLANDSGMDILYICVTTPF